jgi:hypothetical protein
LSIWFFFLLVCPVPVFQKVAKWTIGFIILCNVVMAIIGALQRQPLYLVWEGWKVYPPQGAVLDVTALALSHAAMNVALDIWMLILPLTQVIHLGLKPKKKIGVILIFSVGIL